MNLVVVKKGEAEVPGLTDKYNPRRLGPKRASRIRKLFNLTKQDDVRKYVVKREVKKEGKKAVFKAPQIQRLVTPLKVQRKRHRVAVKRQRSEQSKAAAVEYQKVIAQRNKDRREKRRATVSRRRQSTTSQQKPAEKH